MTSLIEAWNEYQGLNPESLSLFERIRTQMEITAKYQLGVFDLEKVVTRMNAMHLAEDLVLDYSGTNELTMDDLTRRYFSGDWHERDLPSLFLEIAEAECFTAAAEKDVLIWAWTCPEWPINEEATSERWRNEFRKIGFVSDEETTLLPESEILLFRGEKFELELLDSRRMSWTSSRTKAQWFADRFGTPGMVLERLTAPSEIMAMFTSRGESEYVLDIDSHSK